MSGKKVCSMLVICGLVLSAGSVPARAQALGSVQNKQVREIASDFAEKLGFSVNYGDFTYEEGADGKRFQWSPSNGSGNIRIDTDGQGRLLSYRRAENTEYKGLGEIKEEEALQTAKLFMKNAFAKDSWVWVNNKKSTAESLQAYWFSFQLFVNDMPVNEAYCDVAVSRYTGRVLRLEVFIDDTVYETQFRKADTVIETEQAKEKFLSKAGFTLYYGYEKDSKTGQYMMHPIYAFRTNMKNYGVDAETGKFLDLTKLDKTLEEASYIEEEALRSDRDDSSRAEETMLFDADKYISRETAEAEVKKAEDFLKLGGSSEKSAIQTGENDTVVWRLSYANGSEALVDAVSGKIVSYTDRSEKAAFLASGALNDSQARNLADSFLNAIVPEEFAKCRFVRGGDTENGESYFGYKRQENGADVYDNYIIVTVNKKTGMVTNYEMNWIFGAEFPSLEKVITPGQAFDSFCTFNSYQPTYYPVKGKKDVIAYQFTEPYGSFYVDAFTGQQVTWNGLNYSQKPEKFYNDMDGRDSEKAVKILFDNGYYLPGESFRPNQAITQSDFLFYLYSDKSYRNQDNIYDAAVRMSVISEKEIAPDQKLTFGDAAKIAVHYLDFKNDTLLTEVQGIENPFSDTISGENLPYAAACYELNIYRGDKSGSFCENNEMTRGQAAQFLYNLLNAAWDRR